MRGKMSLLLSLLIALWAPLCPAEEKAVIPISEQPSGGKRIAVTEFVNRTDFGDAEFAEKARDAFESELASTNRFTLVERSRLNLIMKEQAFSQSGLVDEQTIGRLGRLVSANYICTGAIEGMSAAEKGNEKLRQKALSILGIDRSTDFFGLARGSDPYQTAWDLSLTIAIRVIDVEKGTIVFNRALKAEAPNIRLRQSTTGPVYDPAAAFDILKPVMEEVARQVVRFFPD
jgi:curli biogenesis system outer membrane secretion channel CsgG